MHIEIVTKCIYCDYAHATRRTIFGTLQKAKSFFFLISYVENRDHFPRYSKNVSAPLPPPLCSDFNPSSFSIKLNDSENFIFIRCANKASRQHSTMPITTPKTPIHHTRPSALDSLPLLLFFGLHKTDSEYIYIYTSLWKTC